MTQSILTTKQAQNGLYEFLSTNKVERIVDNIFFFPDYALVVLYSTTAVFWGFGSKATVPLNEDLRSLFTKLSQEFNYNYENVKFKAEQGESNER